MTEARQGFMDSVRKEAGRRISSLEKTMVETWV
jgi:hypothetical protein